VTEVTTPVTTPVGNAAAGSAAPLAWRSVHEGDFHQTVSQWAGRTLVLFGQPGCGACRRAEAIVPVALAGVVQQLLKVDAAAQAALAREFEVFHLPALHLYIDGRYHAPLLCELTSDALRAAVARAASAPAAEAP
jgi:thioredoxin-like negative regulator of GroEL